jgi:hypothetical protein
MSKLNMNLFAFTSWLMINRHAETEDKLRIIDGYDWYNYMWNKYLGNTDVGKQIKNAEYPTMVEAWMGLPTINEGEKSTGENNNPDTTNNTVTTGQNNTGTYPEPNQIWQHYKGGRYEITAMCNHTDTNEVLVIYRSLSFGGFHARPYSEWHDEIWDGEYCLGKRFKLIK